MTCWVSSTRFLIDFLVVVCFKSGMGTGACPGSPLWLTNVSVFAEDPQSREFPLHHYSGLGTQTGFLLVYFIVMRRSMSRLVAPHVINQI